MTFEQTPPLSRFTTEMGDSSPLFRMDSGETRSPSALPYDPKASHHEDGVLNSYRDSSPERDANEAEDDDVVTGAPVADGWTDVSPLRGRTNRKRSNATQSYVCVVVWLVKPNEEDKRGQWVWNEIQDVRRRHDQAYSRWTPHVTLIPPFVVPFSAEERSPAGDQVPLPTETSKDVDLDQCNIHRLSDGPSVLRILAKRIVNVCQRFSAKPLIFEEVSKFPLRRYHTYHLRPNAYASGTTTLVQLQEALAHALPEAIQYSRNASSFGAKFKRRQSYHRQQSANAAAAPTGLAAATNAAATVMSPTSPSASEMLFKPHLTLGQANLKETGKEIERLAQDLITSGRLSDGSQGEGPLRVELNSIQLMFKPIQQSGPYEIFQTFSLRTPLTDSFAAPTSS